jgi:hypothetical protein
MMADDGFLSYARDRWPGFVRVCEVLCPCFVVVGCAIMTAGFGHPGAGFVLLMLGVPLVCFIAIYAGARVEAAYLYQDPSLVRLSVLDGFRDDVTRSRSADRR